MEEDRKYKQRGYQEADAKPSGGGRQSDSGSRQGRPKLPLDVTGPRLPRLVESVAASRCYSCASTLPQGISFAGKCPRCNVDLHCCKQCAYFEPSTRFQCRKPVPERIPSKDSANECELFSPRVTVARDVRPPVAGVGPTTNGSGESSLAPRRASDARAAFDSLFKK